MGEWIATAHVRMDVAAETEEEARDIIRAIVAAAGLRLETIGGPSHGVEGVRLDVPIARRLMERQKAEKAARAEIEAAADFRCTGCGAAVVAPPGGSSRDFGDWWETDNERPLCRDASVEHW